jgi:general secretion pathway protein J
MKRRAPDGFTLLELLVALSLLSMMIAALVGGLRLGTRAWESGRVSVSLEEAETAARAVASQIERAFPANVRRVNGPPVAAFDCGPDFCRFVALSEGDVQWGGLVTTEIGAESAAAALLAWTQVFREDDFGAGRESMRATPFANGLAFIRLSYFGAPEPRQRPQWRDQWREASVLPRLVSVRVGLRGSNGVLESSALVALRQQ